MPSRISFSPASRLQSSQRLTAHSHTNFGIKGDPDKFIIPVRALDLKFLYMFAASLGELQIRRASWQADFVLGEIILPEFERRAFAAPLVRSLGPP